MKILNLMYSLKQKKNSVSSLSNHPEFQEAPKTVKVSRKPLNKIGSCPKLTQRKNKLRASYSTKPKTKSNGLNKMIENSSYQNLPTSYDKQYMGWMDNLIEKVINPNVEKDISVTKNTNYKPKILINPKEVDWISYSKMKQEFIPELKKLKNPEFNKTHTKIAKHGKKQERIGFLEQLDMKRKYFKSSYSTSSPTKEFKSHNSQKNLQLSLKKVNKDKSERNYSKTHFSSNKKVENSDLQPGVILDKHNRTLFKNGNNKGSMRDLISSEHINSIAFPSIKSQLQADSSRITGFTNSMNEEMPSQIKDLSRSIRFAY